jgi:hypothetical protein
MDIAVADRLAACCVELSPDAACEAVLKKGGFSFCVARW